MITFETQQENGYGADGPPPCKKTKPTPRPYGHRRGAKLLRQRKRYVAPSQHLHYEDLPLNIVKGQGQYLFDESGKKYLDTINNVSHVGHCHPKVVEAGVKQMMALNTNSRFLNDRIVSYAKRLTATLPEKLSCCFFTNSGSEANDLALQIARSVTGHKHVVSLEGAYHGHLASLKPLNGSTKFSGEAPWSPDVSRAPLPDVYRGKHTDPETAGFLYAKEIKSIIDKEQSNGKKVAAFIHETLLSCAGQVIPPKGFLEAAYTHIHGAGGLCIADEVQTGFGRVGKHFWSFELQGVCPDIVTMGKPMGNGHPVAAVITTKEIADKFAATGIEYFNTFGGNPVSMAIAESVLSVVKEEGLQDHATEVGSYLLQGLEGLMERHLVIGDIRGVGLFIGVEFVTDRESKSPNKDLALRVVEMLFHDHQIIALADAIHDNVIKIKPPMCITMADCRHYIAAMDAVLTKLGGASQKQ